MVDLKCELTLSNEELAALLRDLLFGAEANEDSVLAVILAPSVFQVCIWVEIVINAVIL